MNAKFFKVLILSAVSLLWVLTTGCDRDSDDGEVAGFPSNGDVFIDTFSAGLEFFPFAGSNFTAFDVDSEEKYQGTASMRFDVPNLGDPNGEFAGGIFPDLSGRDLSGFDALTFWAKGTKAGTINEIGFGNDFAENKFLTTRANLQITTNWRKYTIPIPDPSKLTQEKGLFWYAEGPEDGLGYTFWLDEVKFEKLGTVAQPRPAIMNGQDVAIDDFVGSNTVVLGLTQTYNLESGQDVTVSAAPAYFEFTSSDNAVASVNELGQINILTPGTAVITASLGGVEAAGSLTINSLGAFNLAPTPTEDPANVISIFSNAYTNEPVEFFNGFWQFSTTQGGADLQIGGDDIIRYSELNFVGIQFTQPTIDASEMTNFRLDFLTLEQLDPGDFFRIEIVDFGPDNSFGGGDDSSGSATFVQPTLVSGSWVSFDIPMANLAGLSSKSNLAQIVLVTDATIKDVFIDNIYMYKTPTEPVGAAPTPTLPQANVISLFSDVYNDVTVDTWRTDWSAAATVLDDISINGDAVKRYTNLGFVGVETVNNTVDASAMTHFHVDVWSADFTSFAINLVDFGADNAFGGGDDTQHELTFNNLPQNQWVSLDIPLSDFTGLLSTSNMAQYIFVGQPFENTTVFIDNVYFHN
ncbi:MAG: carbohydrate-binding protein [Flavobacteriaceae bacterium]|nr:carbohydrate-binding protein [Flavobacteriaceae bacterium]